MPGAVPRSHEALKRHLFTHPTAVNGGRPPEKVILQMLSCWRASVDMRVQLRTCLLVSFRAAIDELDYFLEKNNFAGVSYGQNPGLQIDFDQR